MMPSVSSSLRSKDSSSSSPDWLSTIVVSRPPPPHVDAPRVSPQPSILAEYVLFPFYDWIVMYFPTWWVPNKVTLFGVFSTLLASLLVLSSMAVNTPFQPPHGMFLPASFGVPPSPADAHKSRFKPLHPYVAVPYFSSLFSSASSLFTFCAVLNLIYCVADNTDGRLARRLHKSSFIGEYLDHGLDCVTSLLSTGVSMAVMGIDLSNIGVVILSVASVTLLSHVLNYETNVFIWGNRIATVDEAMIFFAFALYFPVLVPDGIVATLHDSVLSTLSVALSEDTLAWVSNVTYVEVVYITYLICQMQVIISIVWRRPQIALRLPILFMALNAATLLLLIPSHSKSLETVLAAAGGVVSGNTSNATLWSTHTFGPFAYPAVWFITAASTCSMIVHTMIYSKCANLPEGDALPFAGVIFVWFAFASCPVAGMILAVSFHAAQILRCVRNIELSHAKPNGIAPEVHATNGVKHHTAIKKD